MNTRVPGTIRPTDEDGEADPAIVPVQAGVVLLNENGVPIVTEDDELILVSVP